MNILTEKDIKLLAALLLLDGLWITFGIGNPFMRMVEDIQGEKISPNVMGLIGAYVSLFFIAKIFLPRVQSGSEAFLLGALVYAVYDFTNLALFKKYDLKIAAMDILWGGTLFYLLSKI